VEELATDEYTAEERAILKQFEAAIAESRQHQSENVYPIVKAIAALGRVGILLGRRLETAAILSTMMDEEE